MQLFSGDRAANLLKGASLIILMYIIFTTYDLARPVDRGFTTIYSKFKNKPRPGYSKYSAKLTKLFIYPELGNAFEVEMDAWLQIEEGDSVQLWSSQHYNVVQKYKYFNRELGEWITNKNNTNVILFFPWFQLLLIGINVIVLWPRFTEFTTVLKPFFFAFVTFLVYRFILL